MDTTAVSTVAGDGGDAQPVGLSDLAELKRMIREVRLEAANQVYWERKNYEDVLFCRWPGQSADGRMWEANLGKKVRPFDGCSDNRVRLTDHLVQIRQIQLTAAAMQAEMRFTPLEGTDTYSAAKWSILARWMKDNYWANSYRKTLKLLARWQESDTPAVTACLVDWVQEKRIEYREVTAESLVQLYIDKCAEAGVQPTPEEAQSIVELCAATHMETELATLLKQLVPGLSAKRARKVAKELQATGKSEMPVPYLFRDGPELKPLRIFDDIFVPANTTDPEKARVVFLRYWKTEPEVREMAATEGWNEEFLQELLGEEARHAVAPTSTEANMYHLKGHEGRSIFEDVQWENRVVRFAAEPYRRKGLYEILVALHMSTNEDGVLGIYQTTFNWFCEHTATDRLPFKRKHGGYPIVWFQREQLTQRMMDSRGVPELAGTEQATFKLLRDSREDHVQIATLPPIKKPANRPHYEITYEPMGSIESDARNPTEFMEPPAYPISADKYWDFIRRDLAEYWGLKHPEVDEVLAGMMNQDMADDFLAGVSRIMKMAIQLCQEYMPDERLQRIVGGNGLPAIRSRAEIQGQFDMSMKMDVRNLDLKQLLEKAKAILENVKPLDNKARVQYSGLAARILQAIDPNWADEAILPEQAASQHEIEDEKAAFVKMLNGVRPEMPEGGIDAQTRLQVLQDELAPRKTNPAAFPPISQASAALIQERLDYLQFQGQQQQNAVTGRLGVDTTKTDMQLAQGGEQ